MTTNWWHRWVVPHCCPRGACTPLMKRPRGVPVDIGPLFKSIVESDYKLAETALHSGWLLKGRGGAGSERGCLERLQMQKLCSLVTVLVAIVLFGCCSGCLSVPAATIPGQTLADFRLRRDVYKAIAIAERASGGSASPIIVDTRVTEAATSPAGDWKESWFVSRSGTRVEYIIAFKPSPSGGTDIGVTIPRRTK
jgi:hypothetical protein